MPNVEMIAEEAEVIISGYAISRCDDGIRVFNLWIERLVWMGCSCYINDKFLYQSQLSL